MKPADLAYWDRFWREPNVGLQWKHWAARDLVETEPVLDIGCGSGLLLELLRKKGLDSLVGRLENDHLIYAAPHHPEYRRYPVGGLLVASTEAAD